MLNTLRTLAVAVCLLLCPLAAWASVGPDDLGDQGKLFNQALREMELSPYEFRFDIADFGFYNNDKYRLHMLNAFMSNPWKISPYTRMWTTSLLQSTTTPTDVLVKAQSKLGQGIRNNIAGYAALDEFTPRVKELGDDNLAIALGELTGRPFTDFKDDSYDQLTPEVRDAATLFCLVLPEVLELRWQALGEPIHELGLEPEDVYAQCVEWTIEEPFEIPDGKYVRSEVQLLEDLLDNVDFDRLNAGAMLLTHCVETMTNALSAAELEGMNYSYSAETQYGELLISCGTSDYTTGGQYLLLIDLCGTDTYAEVGGSSSWYHPVSVVIDLAGDDTYLNQPDVDYSLGPYYDEDREDYHGRDYQHSRTASFGAGILGYGLLVDVAGADSYDCQWLGQGCGVFGTGILWDLAGDDTYNGIGALQGSGTFGTGLLIDTDGDDSYSLYVYGQGYGYTQGVGLLLDGGTGNDTYLANNTDIVYDGPHSPVINLNFAQGFGFGRRDDLSEGHSWMGGLGMLIDGGGDDIREAGIYAMGSAYWGGIGILADKGGDDYYMSAHYTLGAPPHYAIGIVQDDAGDDIYYGYLRQTIGHARDWSIGWFEDSAGNDFYQAGHQSIGQGDVNSIGVFWDKGGDDVYLIHGPGFGQTTTAGSSVPRTNAPGSIRWFQCCVGLFIDGGGLDRYLQVPEEVPFEGNLESLEPDVDAANGKVWHKGDTIDCPAARSVGIDAE